MSEGSCSNGVLVLAEALGEHELNDRGKPLRPWAPAGSVFERAVRRAGYTREEFVIYNTVPTHPPRNYLENAPYERSAIEWGRPYVDHVVDTYRPRCILALGNVATKALTGLSGELRGVGHLRGWVLPTHYADIPVVPTFHPSYLRREAMALFPVLMHDMKLACAVAKARPLDRIAFFSPVLWRDFSYVAVPPRDPLEPHIPSDYLLHPTIEEMEKYLEEARHAELIAYDIETPRSAKVSEDDTDELGEVQILSIQFSTGRGRGVFVPWAPPYDELARRILALPCDKAGANTWRFDDPLLRAHGCELGGRLHDVRWVWHHLQPDMKSGLQFISSFYQEPDFQTPWKHVHQSHPGYYGIRDVDAIMRIMT